MFGARGGASMRDRWPVSPYILEGSPALARLPGGRSFHSKKLRRIYTLYNTFLATPEQPIYSAVSQRSLNMRPVLIKPAGGAFWKSFLHQTTYTRPRTSRRWIASSSSSGVLIAIPRRWSTSSYSDVSTCKPNPNYSTYINYGSSRTGSANLEALKADGKSRFFVALGSNVGDRLDMIEKACLEMEKEEIQIVRTSGLWETKAMYVEDQANFLNGVCEVSPSLSISRNCAQKVC